MAEGEGGEGTASVAAAKGKAKAPVRNLQDTFLAHLKDAQTPVTVFLVSGVKLQGRVTDFDGFTVALTRDGATQLVYKRVISTIAPIGPISLYEGEEGEPRRPPRPSYRSEGGPRPDGPRGPRPEGPGPGGPPRGPRRPPPTRPIIERRKLT